MSDSSNRDPIICTSNSAQLGGCHDISFPSRNPDCPDLPLIVAFTLPGGAIKSTRGFLTGDGLMKVRCCITEEGVWSREAKNVQGRCIKTGIFQASLTPAPGDWVVWAKRS